VTGRRSRALARVAVAAAAVALWEFVTRRAADPFFPPPSRIVERMHALWFSGPAADLWLTPDARQNLLPSLGRMLTGLAIAAAIGVVVGTAVGRAPLLRDLLDPVMQFARAVPTPMLVPVFIVLLRIGTPMELATIVVGAVWPILLNTADGVASVDPAHLDVARVFRLSRRERLLRVILPSATPRILAGIRLSLSLSLILMVFSEMVGASEGIGYELINAQTTFDLPGMWSAIVLLGLLGYLLNAVLTGAERALLDRRGVGAA
jgi:ABC-type nitrate/sulfonate/bicarbonate transport system permease component